MHVTGLSIYEQKDSCSRPVDAMVIADEGIVGDLHFQKHNRQVSLLPHAVIESLCRSENRPFQAGLKNENIIVAELEKHALHLLDVLTFPSGAELEVTAVGSAFQQGALAAETMEASDCHLSEYGVFARVRRPGLVRINDTVIRHQRVLRVLVLTVSDRAAAGVYEDRSGPAIEESLQDYCRENAWLLDCRRAVIPDDAEHIEQHLIRARDAGIHIVMTTGGTGPARRDITPDVVVANADKVIPGIMEYIRLRSAERIPTALLSRSVAAVLGNTLVYTLPGNPRAVQDYMAVIRQTLQHLLYVLQGLDVHG